MKKKSLIISFLLALIACTFFGVSNKITSQSAYAAEVFEITFDTNGGTLSETTMTTSEDGTLESLPVPTKNGYVFNCWKLGTETVTKDTVYSQNSTLFAIWERKLFTYTISQSGENFIITGNTSSSSLDYTLSATSLEEAITQIKNDMVSTNLPISVNFNNISLTDNLNLSFEDITISGELNLNEFSIIFTAPVNLAKLTLETITLNATSSQDLLKIDGNIKTDLTISNANFNSIATNNYAVKFINSIHYVTVKNAIVHQTSFFYNHETGISSSFDSSLNLENQTNQKLSITIPFNEDGAVVLRVNKTNKDLFNFIPNQDNFRCFVSVINGTSIIIQTEFDINFEANGGSFETGFSFPATNYKKTTETLFPTAENLTKTHSTLNGFAGKLTLSENFKTKYSLTSSVLYFDKTSLETFIQAGQNYSELETYFSSNIPESINGFTYYKYDSENQDLNFKAVQMMLELNQTPEFVALWSESTYKISFEENGGTTVDDISGKFGTSITLPTTTKAGFDFAGWFVSETSETEFNLTTMPDDNITLYARWIPHTNKLILDFNNNTANIEKDVVYQTLLSSIPEINSENFSKTGFTFVGWFTDSSLSNELNIDTMPDENLTLFAKWSINTYTITLFYNHRDNDGIFKTLTQEYDSDITSLKSTTPQFEGFKFMGWFTDKNGQFDYSIPDKMPANTESDSTLKIYAFFVPVEYKITFYYKTSTYYTIRDLHFGDRITMPANPTISGFIFDNWYADPALTTLFTETTMPSRDLSVYAKMIDKKVISIDEKIQTYNLSKNNGFALSLQLTGFKVEYLVNGSWTITTPTKKGTYDVRITRNEDSEYKAFATTIAGGLKIIANEINISIYSLILYCLAGIELICSIIVLFLRKQRKTYLTYSVVLPFGVIQTNQFISFLVALTLAVFGFVLLIIQVVKLKQINSDIAKISTEEHGYKPPDVSENQSISKKVNIILEKEGFINAKDEDYQDGISLDSTKLDTDNFNNKNADNSDDENLDN